RKRVALVRSCPGCGPVVREGCRRWRCYAQRGVVTPNKPPPQTGGHEVVSRDYVPPSSRLLSLVVRPSEGVATVYPGDVPHRLGDLVPHLGRRDLPATKGTRAHVQAGWAYVASMACLNGSAFGLYNLTGGFNTFHALAVFSLATVTAGVAQVLGRRRW